MKIPAVERVPEEDIPVAQSPPPPLAQQTGERLGGIGRFEMKVASFAGDLHSFPRCGGRISVTIPEKSLQNPESLARSCITRNDAPGFTHDFQYASGHLHHPSPVGYHTVDHPDADQPGIHAAQLQPGGQTGGGSHASEGDEYDIRVQLDDAEIRSADDIGNLYVQAGEDQILLRELVEGENSLGPTTISHKDKQRMVTVTSDVASGALGDKISELRKLGDDLNLKSGYVINFGGEAEHMGEAFEELFRALFLAIILTYMMLAAILESYKHPFTIMLTLPLGLIGVLVSLFLSDNTISIFSLISVVMLVGIVVNNGILLIDYINHLRAEGRRLDDAIIEACPVRLRPIIMTNLATALGMLPLALGFGAGGELRAPMAIVAIGGLLTSALFTLYIIPIIYRTFEREKKVV